MNEASQASAADAEWPADAVEVGRIVDAWGIKGWFRVEPLSSHPMALFSSRRWWLKPPERPARRPAGQAAAPAALPSPLKITHAREQGDGVVAAAQDVPDRDTAEALRGARVFVARSSFPTPAPDEYYWVDLIGLEVVNRDGIRLGRVAGLLDTGVHSVLRVCRAMPADAASKPSEERLIPFVGAYVDSVDLASRTIVVDWGLDY